MADSAFKSEYKSYLTSLIQIYQRYGAPFSINLYPFFAAPDLPNLMDFLLGKASAAGSYGSMLEQMYDCTHYAMEDAVSNHGVEIVVTETGWSSYSSSYGFATVSNANEYTANALRLMNDPNSKLYGVKVFWFELFDEDLKSGGDWEQHFGWFDLYGSLKLTISDTDNGGTGDNGGGSTDCGYVPSSCQGDLEWAATEGTKSYWWWYPDFESITGVSLNAAGTEDVQLYWFCTNTNPNGNCNGLEAPCARSCGNAAFEGDEDGESGSVAVDNLTWILIGSAMALGVIFFVAMIIRIRIKRKRTMVVNGDDDVSLKDDQQLRNVDEQRIELEESVDKVDGDTTTIAVDQ